MSKRASLWAFLVGVALLIPAPSRARTLSECDPDVKKFCGDVRWGDGRLETCLSQHERELSPKCASARKDLKKQADKAISACQADVTKLCKDVPPGRGRRKVCLEEHKAKLSPSCARSLDGV